MIEKPRWLKHSIAKPTGFYTARGERLKGTVLSQEFCDAWNNEQTIYVEQTHISNNEIKESTPKGSWFKRIWNKMKG